MGSFPLKPGEVPLCAALSPDGRRLAVGTDKNCAEIWTIEFQGAGLQRQDREVPLKLEHSGDVISVAFSPDGTQVATASADDSARVWNAETGEPTTPFLVHESRVVQAVFSPDGRRLLTASWDETSRVWDAQTGEAITPPLLHSSPVVFATFSPDGNTVATAGEDGNVQLWNLPPSPLKQDDVRQVAQLLSGRTIDNALSFTPAFRNILKSAWEKMRDRLPQLLAPAESMTAWHARLARQCERAKDWYGERFHLDRLLLANPGDSTLLAQREQADDELNKLSREQKERQEAAGAPPKVP
jgi:dipeptidyl aminopeptidase/acylaminoacyl peptidase